MKPPGCRKTRSRHVGAYEDHKMGKARERVEVRDITEEEIERILRESVPAAEELDRKLEPLFRLGPEQAGLVLDTAKGTKR